MISFPLVNYHIHILIPLVFSLLLEIFPQIPFGFPLSYYLILSLFLLVVSLIRRNPYNISDFAIRGLSRDMLYPPFLFLIPLLYILHNLDFRPLLLYHFVLIVPFGFLVPLLYFLSPLLMFYNIFSFYFLSSDVYIFIIFSFFLHPFFIFSFFLIIFVPTLSQSFLPFFIRFIFP